MVDDLEIENIDAILNPLQSGEMLALLAEFKLNLNNYLQELISSPVRSLSDVIVFNKDHPQLVSTRHLRLAVLVIESMILSIVRKKHKFI